jgi:hypothetical protein
MEPALLGLVVFDPIVPIAAERRNRTAGQAIESIQQRVGEIPIVFECDRCR